MDAPSMVQRSGDTLIIRSVVSGDQIFWGGTGDENQTDSEAAIEQQHRKQIRRQLNNSDNNNDICAIETVNDGNFDGTANVTKDDAGLPQCKIKRNYSCNSCSYFTQNPRHFLAHLRDLHGEKIIINECKHCLYASRHYQKLVRHMKMVHGSTEGLEEQALSRKRASQLAREQKKRRQMAAGTDATADIPVSLIPVPILKLKSPDKTINSASNARDIATPTGTTAATTSAASDAIVPSATNEFLNHKFLKCSLCDFTTLYRTQIVEHERDEHNKTKFFRCQKCSYVTHIKARFSKHVKYHSMPMIKCIMCDFRTPYKWNLDRHMKNHGGTGPFKCSACNFTADIKQSLTVHEMNHHVPPVGHASGMSLAGPRRRNKVGATDAMSNDADAISNDAFDITPTDMMQIELNDQTYGDMPTNLASPAKKPLRPLPNLIPIQPLSVQSPSNDAVNLTTRSKIRAIDEAELKESPEMQLKRAQSVLKDFATLFGAGGDDIFDGSETSQLSPVSNASSVKRKNTNFFNELKEKFATGNRDGNNLACQCGHTSKCLSEAIIHKKSCGKILRKGQSTSPINLSMQSGSGSTRCQYCRHRCKTSTDLYIHMQSCVEAARSSADSFDSGSDNENESNVDKIDVSGDITDEGMISGEPHPMENKVFVWNKMPTQASVDAANANDGIHKANDASGVEDLCGPTSEDSENNEEEKADDSTYYGVETAPGYGEVTKKMNPDDEAMTSSLKKVFKCPHCSFWASTASRFHVHIVGHLNRKPFECSLCSYRSNWRWDITKHIRLKTIRDVSHKNAKVLMNDETGRRNYTKYNKYITLMKVTEEDGDPKLLKSGEMTASQEAAALTFPRKRSNSSAMGQQNAINSHAADDEMTGSGAFQYDGNSAQSAAGDKTASTNINDYDLDSRSTDTEATKKVSFKCKKCNYRHTSRDVVLAHVKSHYKENSTEKKADDFPAAPIPTLSEMSNEYNNNVYGFLSAISLTPTTANKILLQPSILYNAPSQPQRVSINATTTGQALNVSESKTAASNATQAINKAAPTNNENGEMEEASSGFTSVNGWRCPAPYRCGHCHQVSNWKHVIQRHCRLKHDGDIRIEMTEKGSRMYQPLTVPASGIVSNVTDTVTATMIPSVGCQAKVDDKKPWLLANTAFAAPNSKNAMNELQRAESDDKKQMISHAAKQSEVLKAGIDLTINENDNGKFRCNLCDFDAGNAFALNQHMKMHPNKSDKSNHPLPTLTSSIANKKLDNDSVIVEVPDDEPASVTLSKTNGEQIKDTNVKQIEKIQELRSQADVTRKDQASARSAHNSKNDNEERCPHCPYITTESEALKEHMMCHICVSGHIDLANCDYCDYSIADESLLIEHNNIHFDLIKNKQKTVAFYTIYDDLELTSTTTNEQQNNNDDRHPNQYATTVKKLYPKIENIDFHYSSDKENKVLVDINTGQILKNNY